MVFFPSTLESLSECTMYMLSKQWSSIRTLCNLTIMQLNSKYKLATPMHWSIWMRLVNMRLLVFSVKTKKINCVHTSRNCCCCHQSVLWNWKNSKICMCVYGSTMSNYTAKIRTEKKESLKQSQAKQRSNKQTNQRKTKTCWK